MEKHKINAVYSYLLFTYASNRVYLVLFIIVLSRNFTFYTHGGRTHRCV